jgi:hypothetical protein
MAKRRKLKQITDGQVDDKPSGSIKYVGSTMQFWLPPGLMPEQIGITTVETAEAPR